MGWWVLATGLIAVSWAAGRVSAVERAAVDSPVAPGQRLADDRDAGSAAMPRTSPMSESITLLDLSRAEDRERVAVSHGRPMFEGDCLVFAVPAQRGGTVTVRPPGERWDVRGFTRLSVDVGASRGEEIRLKVMAKNPGATDWSNSAISLVYLDQGQRDVRPIYLFRNRPIGEDHPEMAVFEGMHGLPGGAYRHWHWFDGGRMVELTLTLHPRPYPQEVRVYSVRATHPVVPEEMGRLGDAFFPFIDTYGQYRHGTWPGKIQSDDDLRRGFAEEERDLADHPPPADRSRWGGWKDGPRQEATGFFRTQKVNGRWWLVDPDGYLFWSHGVTGVGLHGGATSVVGRERYFSLPDGQSPLAVFRTDKGYDFTAANLYRALGPNWSEHYLDLSHRRLASWGMNTLGMWSQREAMLRRRTPYTVAIHCGFRSIGHKLPDPFDPGYRQNLRGSLERQAETAGDGWNIGYFVDNELNWGQPVEVVGRVVAGSPKMAAKRELVGFLRERYGTIESLNARLGSSLADWDAVLQSTRPLALEKIRPDCEEFYRRLCEAFFRTCREEVKRLAPHQLYLGCRFNHSNDIVMAVAARYCDVISYNLYEWDIRGRRWPGVDKPFISSEFHFGAQDRGMWGLGLRWASSQQDRARLYRDYVRGALANPQCVGTHWFQYNSQAFTGRGDGENHQIGMCDIGGRPWPELRRAVREVGVDLYRLRASQPETAAR